MAIEKIECRGKYSGVKAHLSGEECEAVLEWNDNLAQLSDVQAFLATNGILENARPADEWRRAQGGGWE